jgi:hypothetical protein
LQLTIPVRIDAKLRFATAHDDYDRKGQRSLINDLNKRSEEDNLSYYQKSTLQYGRERRGSTSIAGAWEGVVLSAAETAVVAAGGRPRTDEEALLHDEAALMAEVEHLDRRMEGRFGSPRSGGGGGGGGF